jgi:6-phosphofructokinase 1
MDEFTIKILGNSRFDSPLQKWQDPGGREFRFRDENERILLAHRLTEILPHQSDLNTVPGLEVAGPRRRLFFDPPKTGIGIVTCGGLCPGLNNVIRDLVLNAWHLYGVRQIVGFRYGYRGLTDPELQTTLRPAMVKDIHEQGGSVLSSSRGEQKVEKMVDTLVDSGISVLFVIGGDGSMRGALAICKEIERRGLEIGVIGIPKTIDNDLRYMDQSFGFDTAYSKALEAIDGAHREAEGAPNGIGLVKLMGRHSGFIACFATLASNQVNYTLIPEVPFVLEGLNGFLESLKRRLEKREHAVIVVAEGAGQDILQNAGQEKDASGNIRLKDIGLFLADRIRAYFKGQNTEVNLKYIDPSYIIRSVKANAADSVLCSALALNAVHAGLAGKTEMSVAIWRRSLVHVPLQKVAEGRNQVDPSGALWLSVLASTGQPVAFH